MPLLQKMRDHVIGQHNLPDTLETEQGETCIGGNLTIGISDVQRTNATLRLVSLGKPGFKLGFWPWPVATNPIQTGAVGVCVCHMQHADQL